MLYLQGNGVIRSEEKAAYWFEKAAQQGNANAQTRLGVLWYDGYKSESGTVKNILIGKFWINKAAEQGDKLAIMLNEIEKMTNDI